MPTRVGATVVFCLCACARLLASSPSMAQAGDPIGPVEPTVSGEPITYGWLRLLLATGLIASGWLALERRALAKPR